MPVVIGTTNVPVHVRVGDTELDAGTLTVAARINADGTVTVDPAEMRTALASMFRAVADAIETSHENGTWAPAGRCP